MPEEKSDRRWPRWVYAEGADPDYRFTFANERTFLAWVRTGLALLAAGVALDVVNLSVDQTLQTALSTTLNLLGVLCAVAAWIRWAMAERAMRTGGRLPSFGVGGVLTIGLLAIGVAAVVGVAVGG